MSAAPMKWVVAQGLNSFDFLIRQDVYGEHDTPDAALAGHIARLEAGRAGIEAALERARMLQAAGGLPVDGGSVRL